MDTVGAIAGPLTALWLLNLTKPQLSRGVLWTLLPGMIAVLSFWLLVRERPFEARKKVTFLTGLHNLPRNFREFLLEWACSVREIFRTRF